MAFLIEGGVSSVDALLYGKPHPGTINFINQQLTTMTHNLTDAGARFMQGINQLYDRFTGSTAARIARAAARSVASIWQSDEIQQIVDLGRMQHAPMKMQRWLMAEPTVRQYYIDQRCDGYSDTYVDLEPGKVGEQHYDYRRVMNGIVTDTEDGWTSTTYHDDLNNDDAELHVDEQHDILISWTALVKMIRAGKEDPTSRYAAELG